MSPRAPEKGKIREPIADGILYPSGEKELTDTIASLIGGADTGRRDAFGIITPHASLDYVGSLMGLAYKSAADRTIDIAVILAPIHRDDDGEILLPESRFFQTPLGVAAVNQQYIEELLGCSTAIIKNDIPYLEEHAVEVQLPFIQFLFPESTIVPVMIGRSKSRNIRVLANALQLTFADIFSRTLFVATTNLSSYQGKAQSEEDAATLLKLIQDGDAPALVQAISQKKISAHGASCIAAMLSFEKPRLSPRLLGRFGSDAIQKGAKKAIQYAAISLHRKER